MRTLLRAVLAGAAFAALGPGLQATFGPRSFYSSFPLGRGWLELLPPFNEHLVRDVGAFYLAFALLLAWATVTLLRDLIVPLAVAWSLFSALHSRVPRDAPRRFRNGGRDRADGRPARRDRAAACGGGSRADKPGTG